MANDIDSLISQARTTAVTLENDAIILTNALMARFADINLAVEDVSDIDLTTVDLPTYTQPARDTTPMPVYADPSASLPVAPDLASYNTITMPPERDDPTLDTSNLFAFVAPSDNIPDFTEAAPDLRVEDLIAEMDAIAEPVIREFDLPSITPLTLSTRPTLNLPSFDAPDAPETLERPTDYDVTLEDRFNTMHPIMQAFVDERVSTWISQYSPEYTDWNSRLRTKLNGYMDGTTVLPDQIEAAMMTRARSRAEQEFTVAEQGMLEQYSKFGLVEPPGALVAGIHQTRVALAGKLADQSTDIYIDRKNKEMQWLQFVLQLASSNIQNVRQIAVSYANIVGQSLQTTLQYASSVAEKQAQVYDHLIGRSRLVIEVMNALNTQYELKLKAALSELEGFRLELDAAKAQKDVELAQLQAVETAFNTQRVKVDLYRALIDAVKTKGDIEQLKNQQYQIRADVFMKQLAAKEAAFRVYEAAMNGDAKKLEAELSKLEVFKAELQADNLKLDAQTKVVEATTAANNGKIEVFKSEGDVYKLLSQIALDKFTAQAEVKKLAQSVYMTELDSSVKVFDAKLTLPKLLMDIMMKQYTLKVDKVLKEAGLELDKLKLIEAAFQTAVQEIGQMAGAALNSMNTVVNSSLSAVA